MTKIMFKAYDHDLHRFIPSDEVRIDPIGRVWYKDCAHDKCDDHWTKLHKNAEWLTIEAVTIIGDDYENLKKRL